MNCDDSNQSSWSLERVYNCGKSFTNGVPGTNDVAPFAFPICLRDITFSPRRYVSFTSCSKSNINCHSDALTGCTDNLDCLNKAMSASGPFL